MGYTHIDNVLNQDSRGLPSVLKEDGIHSIDNVLNRDSRGLPSVLKEDGLLSH